MKHETNALLELLKYLKPNKKKIIAIMFLLIFSSVLTFLGPRLSQKLMDDGFILKNYILVVKLAVIILVIEVINSLTIIVKEYLRVNLKLDLNVMFFKEAFGVIECMQMRNLDETNNTQLFQNIQNDISNMTLIVDASFLMVISQVLNILAGVMGLLVISWRLSLIVLLYIPFKLLTVQLFTKKKKKYYAEYMDKSSIFAKWFGDTVNGIKDIKLSNVTNKKTEEFEVFQKGMRETNKKLVFLDSYNNILDKIGMQIILTLIYIISALNKNESVTIGSVFAFVTYTSLVISPLTSLLNLKIILSNILLSSKRYFEFINQPKEDMSGETLVEDLLNEDIIEFDSVSFGYEKNIISKLSFKIRRGEKVLITGDNGSGKTTIIKLLLKFYNTTEGKILVYNNNISNISIKSLRSKIAVVWQNSYLFNDTIHNNICLYENIDKKIFENTLHKCNLYNDYYNKGKNFMIEGNGGNISSGQRQKILLARALVKKEVEIIILDEAMANLDRESVSQLKKIIKDELKNYTIIVISHNCDMLEVTDKIVTIV